MKVITLDAGHGGTDPGAVYGSRLEKDDNLRLALQVRDDLAARCVNVIMTRDTDVFVSLEDRVRIAGENCAGLFVSLHRNSYHRHTPNTNGVSNYIYLTAPEGTRQAAELVLERVAGVGVRSNWGVLRGDYYVLRNSDMPAMLLEMGFIIDPIDNFLFDIFFCEYAAAIAHGIIQSIGMAKPPA